MFNKFYKARCPTCVYCKNYNSCMKINKVDDCFKINDFVFSSKLMSMINQADSHEIDFVTKSLNQVYETINLYLLSSFYLKTHKDLYDSIKEELSNED